MNVYIWEDLDHVSDNCHEQGGLVIVAASLERCHELAAMQTVTYSYRNDGVPIQTIKIDKPPTRVIPCGPDEPEALYVFPDAGCC